MSEVSLPPDICLTTTYDPALLGGVAALHGAAEIGQSGDWTGRLYREFQPSTTSLLDIRLVPYFAWGNRGPGEMTVWIPRSR